MAEAASASTAPIFLMSLPRSGSTLVQRMLGTHPDIATASEPWVLIPTLYGTRTEGVLTAYDQMVAATAIRDFIAELPAGRADYYRACRKFGLELYGAAARGRPWFLDKTPR